MMTAGQHACSRLAGCVWGWLGNQSHEKRIFCNYGLVSKQSLCVVEEELMKAFSEDGNIESSALPFKVSQYNNYIHIILKYMHA